MQIVLVLVLIFVVSKTQAQTWPNEPVGAILITDWSFKTVTGSGWSQNGGAYISEDAGSPISPSEVLTFKYNKGFGGGNSPDIVFHAIDNKKEIYFSYWWKANANWENYPGGTNKLSFIATNKFENIYVQAHKSTDDSDYRLWLSLEMNVCNGHLSGWGDSCGTWNVVGNISNPAITMGQWHRIEVYMKHSSAENSKDGVLIYWMDGQLIGNMKNVNFTTDPWSEFQFSPTWGGGEGPQKSQTDYFWFDHVRISTGGTLAPSNPPNVKSKPNAPKNLKFLGV